MPWSEFDLGWMAGLYEGEGSCLAPTSKNGLRLSITMTDEDVLQRFHHAAGCGCLCGPYGVGRPNRKPFYRWQVEGKPAYALGIALWPFLGRRRRGQLQSGIGQFLHSGPNVLKLTAQDVREIREILGPHPRYGEMQRLADLYGVSNASISSIHRRVTWRNVP